MTAARVVLKQPTRGIARYLVWAPDVTGARELGVVTHRTPGYWDTEPWDARGKATGCLPGRHDRRRDAVEDLLRHYGLEVAA